MGPVLAGLIGVAIALGVVLIIAGFNRPDAQRPQFSTGVLKTAVDKSARSWSSWRMLRLGVGIVLGLVGSFWTGWPMLILLVPLLVHTLPLLLSAPTNQDLALLEALDRWVRTLASLLPTGRSITDAIRASSRQAPPLLAAPLRQVLAHLDDRWTMADALRGMADELASPDADAVLAALALASRRGGTGGAATLAALAENIQDRLRALREIESERAKPRIVVRQITVITLVVLGLAFGFGGQFFEPYRSEFGQVLLVVLVVAYLGSLLLLRRMTNPRRRTRLLGSSS